jgi:hypothetical protein
MTHYTATFANGKTLTRKSNNGYAFAWMATWTRRDGSETCDSGFSASFELAQKAAKPFLPWAGVRGMSAKDRATVNQKNAEFLQGCNLKIEIVPTIAA